MIQVSDTASKKIIDMMKDDGFDASKDYVRVGVKSQLLIVPTGLDVLW